MTYSTYISSRECYSNTVFNVFTITSTVTDIDTKHTSESTDISRREQTRQDVILIPIYNIANNNTNNNKVSRYPTKISTHQRRRSKLKERGKRQTRDMVHPPHQTPHQENSLNKNASTHKYAHQHAKGNEKPKPAMRPSPQRRSTAIASIPKVPRSDTIHSCIHMRRTPSETPTPYI